MGAFTDAELVEGSRIEAFTADKLVEGARIKVFMADELEEGARIEVDVLVEALQSDKGAEGEFRHRLKRLGKQF